MHFSRVVIPPGCWSVVRTGSPKRLQIWCWLTWLTGGPLRKAGFRCAVVSITKPKAAELKKLAQDTAEASGLRGLSFPKSPAPGRIVSRWGACEILSAADYEGHASGFDLVINDEPGAPSRAIPGVAGRFEVLLDGSARQDDLPLHRGRFSIHPRGYRVEGA